MYLKSLSMKGFKSFAGKSDLVFEPGTTVIVGPNGSGKSNIVDAFMWVTGEQSARSLRSGKMQDVIFAGSAEKSPMGVAEVTLLFNNEGQVFPVDYNEVSFTRRLYKSGESEYCFNGNSCRLADITDLLLHTNMGRDMYSIVGQGRLDAVLSGRSEERRILIEEAAGLAKYKRRKEKALRKLAATERNLVRVGDITAEIKRQLKPLETQAKMAREHKKLVDELRECETRYITSELDGLIVRCDALKKEATSAESALKKKTDEAGKAGQAADEAEGSLAAARARSESLKDRKYGLMNNAERLQGRIRLLKEKELNLRLIGEQFGDEVAAANAELEKTVKTKKGCEAELDKARHRLSGLEGKDIARRELKTSADLALAREALSAVRAEIAAEERILLRQKAQDKASVRPPGITKRVYETIEVRSGYEKAVEVLLGKAVDAWLSKDVKLAAEVMGDQHVWPALLVGTLIEEPVKKSANEEGLVALKDVVIPKHISKDVFEALFVNVFIVDSVKEALRLAGRPGYEGARFVTRDGASLSKGLATPAGAGAADIVANNRRLSDLAKREKAAAKEEAALSVLARKEKEAAQSLDRDLTAARQAVSESEARLMVIKERENNLTGRLKSTGIDKAEVKGAADAEERMRQALEIERLRGLTTRLLTIVEKYENLTAKELAAEKVREQNRREELAWKRRQADEVRQNIVLLERDARRDEIAEAQLEPKIAALTDQLKTEFGLSPAEATEAYPGQADREELTTKMSEIRKSIEYMGPINPIAAEEFEEVKDRQEHLEAQLKDLKRSERSLGKVISLMDGKMAEKFADVFEKVDKSFQEVFKYMFPDGKAKLIMTDPDDPLSTGIDIEAQPSGRRLKKVSMLSGGESAMTALALLFGLFQINPAPFYILDEADVALDDINLQRFVALVKRYKKQAQFLVVTHQRRTMEVADILYGVAMQKDGVSRLLSQKIEQIEAAIG